MPSGHTRAAALVTLVLVAGAVAAFVQTQALKAERPPVRAIELDGELSAGCGCEQGVALLRVRLAEPQRIDAAILDEDDRLVRTLADGALRGSGPSTFRWTGRDDSGELVPEGEYRLRVDTTDPDRTIVFPRPVEVRR